MLFDKAPSEWPFKYWIIIGSLFGGPNAANFVLNVTANKPVTQSELRIVKNDVGQLANSYKQILEHTKAIDVDQALLSLTVARHDERLKDLNEIKRRLLKIEERYVSK